MNIWEDVYHKNKGIGKVPVYPQSDRNPFPEQQQALSSEYETHQQLTSDTSSLEDEYRRNNRAQSDKHIGPNQRIKQKQAVPKSKLYRFTPKILSDKLSTPYPEILSKLHFQFTDIWANIQVETKKDVETLLVCGATRKEGNTFVSFHLAMFLSKEYNMKVLYMDTNLNHSAVSKMKNLPGLYSFISENKDLSSLIVKTEYPGLYMLPSGAGNGTNHASNIFPRESIDTLIDFCRNNFAVTIIDGQPLTISPVMIELAKAVDMTALVCRYGYSRREVTKLAIDKLQKYGVTSIGVIMNDRQFPIPQTIYKLMG
jgi:Mrp family chromosome partitioning ATPase